MAKTIKFNLICDKNPVRTIEDLQNNFSVEDILGYYQDGLLKKWLMVRGYTEQLEKVNRIREKDPMKILAELIRIFDMEQDNEKIKEEIEMLSLKKKREESIAYYEKQSAKESSILRDYYKKYTQLINGLLVARDDIVTIKKYTNELATNYHEIFQLVYREVFYMLYDENCWLSIMCFLAHKDLRDFYIPTTDELLGASSSHKYKDKKDVFNLICQGIRSSEFASAMGAYLRHFKSTADTNWKKLEYGEKNYMIIRMDPGFYVRATGKESYKNNGFSKAENGVYRGFLGASEILQNVIQNTQNTLEYYDISNKFVILKGLECKCNSQDENIYYMEV